MKVNYKTKFQSYREYYVESAILDKDKKLLESIFDKHAAGINKLSIDEIKVLNSLESVMFNRIGTAKTYHEVVEYMLNHFEFDPAI